jgi:hypothetical protein
MKIMEKEDKIKRISILTCGVNEQKIMLEFYENGRKKVICAHLKGDMCMKLSDKCSYID